MIQFSRITFFLSSRCREDYERTYSTGAHNRAYFADIIFARFVGRPRKLENFPGSTECMKLYRRRTLCAFSLKTRSLPCKHNAVAQGSMIQVRLDAKITISRVTVVVRDAPRTRHWMPEQKCHHPSSFSEDSTDINATKNNKKSKQSGVYSESTTQLFSCNTNASKMVKKLMESIIVKIYFSASRLHSMQCLSPATSGILL